MLKTYDEEWAICMVTKKSSRLTEAAEKIIEMRQMGTLTERDMEFLVGGYTCGLKDAVKEILGEEAVK